MQVAARRALQRGALVPLTAQLSSSLRGEASFSSTAIRQKESREAETSSSSPPRGDKKKSDAWHRERATSALLNLMKPADLYPAARSFRRRIIIHVGPTNSGKTHAALKAFMASPSGVYCSPLRLLAWEVADRVNGKGVPCDLLTGQERSEVPDARHVACTVEMADLMRPIDVAVVDEIHLLGDPNRGWSFTRALLGLPARELHLCGDPAALDLVAQLAGEADDDIEVHHYERLSPLVVSKKPLSQYNQAQKGDAFIAFSRRDIHSLRATLEAATGQLCAMVYGGLPPETRSGQAKLFNNPSKGYNLLAASDAIGMGLNLNIRRVVFSTMEKFDGTTVRDLSFSEIKQIAGRAGRYKSVFPEGVATAMDARDVELLRAALASPPVALRTAGLFPSVELLSTFVQADPEEGLPGAIRAFRDRARKSDHYVMRECQDMLAIAELLQPIGLDHEDQLMLSMAPADPNDPASAGALLQFARALRQTGSVTVRLIHVPFLITPTSEDELKKLEARHSNDEASFQSVSGDQSSRGEDFPQRASFGEAHRNIDMYIWLAQRMAERFPDLQVATATREAVAVCIDEGLRVLARPREDAHKKALKRAVQSGKRRVEAAALAVRMAVETAEDERRRLQSSRRSLWETIGGDGGGAAAQEARRRPPQAAAEAAVTAAVAAGTAAAVI